MYFKSLALACMAAATVSAQSTPNLAQLLEATPELSNLTSIISVFPRLAAALANATDITILAPSNQAFNKFLGGSAINISPNNSETVQAILAYHVLRGVVPSSDFTTTPAFVPTLLEAPFANVTGGQVVEGVKNGSDVVIISGLKAPSKVTTADLAFTGGIVHIIDTVLTVPERITRTAARAKLTTLLELLEKTGLATTVDETPDVTVFAPTNAAFNAAADVLGKLDANAVATVLKEHVVAGTVGYSSKLKNGDILKTLSGGTIQITIKDGDIFANGVKVVSADILVANGVVHVIDGILRPPFPNATSGVPINTPKPTGTGTGSNPTGSPIVPYEPNSASSVHAGWMSLVAMFIAAGIYLHA